MAAAVDYLAAVGQAFGPVGRHQHALASASAAAHWWSLADAQVSLPRSQATVTAGPAHFLALQVTAHVMAEEAVGAAVHQTTDRHVTAAAAAALVVWAAPALVAKRLGLVDPPRLQLGGAGQQRASGWLRVQCTGGQDPHEHCAQGRHSAGGQVALLESEWRKMRMAAVRVGCGGAGGRTGLAWEHLGAEPGRTESCIRLIGWQTCCVPRES